MVAFAKARLRTSISLIFLFFIIGISSTGFKANPSGDVQVPPAGGDLQSLLDWQVFEDTLYEDIYNANFPSSIHIQNMDQQGDAELVIVGVLTDYSLIPTPNTRCSWCNQWRLSGYNWNGFSLVSKMDESLDVGYDTQVRSALGTIRGETKVVGVGNLYPCGSGEIHAGMAVFNSWLSNEHYDWGDRQSDPCHHDLSTFRAVDVADVDKDGTTEIVAGGSGDNTGGQSTYREWLLAVRTSDGSDFKEELYHHIDHGDGTEILTDLIVADVDGDTHQEIIATGYSLDTGVARSWLHIMTWDDDDLKTEHETSFDIGSEDYLHRLAVANVTGDSKPEIVLVGRAQTGTTQDWYVKVVRWNGSALSDVAHKSWSFGHDAVIQAVDIYDVDQDGQLEILLAGSVNEQDVPGASGGYYYVHKYADWHLKILSLSGSTWSEEASWEWASSRDYDTNDSGGPDSNDEGALGRLYDLEVGDLNGDGVPEIAAVGEWVWVGWHVKILHSPLSAQISSKYSSTPPEIDGDIRFGEWQDAQQVALENGFFAVLNDSLRLYVLLDVLEDSEADANDGFWLTIDVDGDGQITNNVDLNYKLDDSTGNLRYQYYTGPGAWTDLQPSTFSSRAQGFGCFYGDDTKSYLVFPTQVQCSEHRLWELGIDLAEIGASGGDTVRLGVRIFSGSPDFTDEIPEGFSTDFSELTQVELGSPSTPLPVPDPLASIRLEADAIEFTQAIQDRDNTLPLAAEKRTVARVYAYTHGVTVSQPAKAYLYGSANGVDLVGSPLAALTTAPTAITRDKLEDTANFLLPHTWVTDTVTYWSRAADLDGNFVSSPQVTLTYTDTGVPTFWIVPINTGTSSAPNLVSNVEIYSQESAMEAVLPVKGIHFIQKDWNVIGATTITNTLDELEDYYDEVLYAWVNTLFDTGQIPDWELPNQIYGFTPEGGGASIPTFIGGSGHIARGYRGTSGELTMVHEVTHNLDHSSDGTWGRHAPGCNAPEVDPDWPYNLDFGIQEVGFDTRFPWEDTHYVHTAIPDWFPDYMSYCDAGHGWSPTKWTSPYRWENLYDYFESVASLSAMGISSGPQIVYYISAVINSDGTGELNPILEQPGIPSSGIAPGDYTIEIQDTSGTPLSTTSFKVAFINTEGETRESVSINYHIPVVSGAAKVYLKHGEDVLDAISASDHLPTVTVLEPNGGETWDDVHTIRWEAEDLDGAPLRFSIFYKPDSDEGWFPVAWDVSGDSLSVDSIILPGGEAARIRVIATDGFHNSQDDSDGTFTVSDHVPEVWILSPESESRLVYGEAVQLKGQATDTEDGYLPDESFYWEMDGLGLGTGRMTEVKLPFGPHTITLFVLDHDGNIGQANVQIEVGWTLYLPFTIR